jgi:UDP-glucose 4-epimerase
MRILVTGGAGFIGSHVVDALVEAGHEVGVLDDLSSGRRANVPGSLPLYEVDLRDRQRTWRVLDDFRPEVVSHHAAQVSVAVSMRRPARDAAINVLGGLNLLDACVHTGVERVLFASTGGAIYGEVAEGARADEATPPHPMSPYAVSKLAFEQLLGIYEAHKNLRCTILRYANVYGPRQDPHGEAGVVAIFLARALRGESLRINGRSRPGDGGCIRDYVFVGDVAQLNVAAVAGRIGHRVVNVATGVATDTQTLAKAILKGVSADAALEPAAPRAGDVGRSVLDPSLCTPFIGQMTPLEEGLARTAAWFREHGVA